MIKKHPLSDMQQGFIFHTLEHGASTGSYLTQVTISLLESFKPKLFKQAWQYLLPQFEVLRSYIESLEIHKPKLIVANEAKIPFGIKDISHKNTKEQEIFINDFLKKDIKNPINLSIPPLMRFTIFKLSKNNYCIVWTHHHLLMDASSFSRVLKAAFLIYDSLLKNPSDNKFSIDKILKEVQPKPLRKISQEIKSFYTITNQKNLMQYWQKLLNNIGDIPSLPIQTTANQNSLSQQNCIKFDMGTNLIRNIKEKANAHRLTINAFMQGAWGIVLSKYTNTDDIIFGTVRSYPKLIVGQGIGLFLNTLPVRANLSPKLSILEYLKKIRKQHQNIRKYILTPITQIHRKANIPSGTPLFETVVDFKTQSINDILEWNSAATTRHASFSVDTNYPLLLEIYSENGQYKGILNYKSNLFPEWFIKQLVSHYKKILLEIATKLNHKIFQIEVLSQQEKKQILIDWNKTQYFYPKKKTVVELFEDIANKRKNKIAVKQGKKQITYKDLNRKSNQLAHELIQKGIQREMLVGIYINQGIETIISILGILKAGAAYVPIDPHYPAYRNQYIIKNSNLKNIIITQSLHSQIKTSLLKGTKNKKNEIRIFVLERIITNNIAGNFTENPSIRNKEKNIAYVIYTSGSTGVPKGVAIEHHSIVNLVYAQRKAFNLSSKSRVLGFASYNFDASVSEIFCTLTAGATLVLPKSNEIVSEKKLIHTLKKEKISVATLPPSLLNVLTNLNSLRLKTLITAGEPCTENIIKKYLNHCDTFVNAYGPTENCVCTSLNVNQKDTLPNIGKPINNVNIFILDKFLNPVPKGVIGELYITGDNLARGYLNQEKLTNERFIYHSFNQELKVRMYKTGDLVRWNPNGTITYVGRNDSQIKLRGYRIEPEGIEVELLKNKHIKQCAVTLRKKNKTQNTLIAYYVTTRKKNNLNSDELKYFLENKLPNYMVPQIFIKLSNIPLTPNKKVNYIALHELADKQPYTEYHPIHTKIEKTLIKLWEDALGVIPIGANDNFFSLGGDSITIIQLLVKAEQQGITLTPRQIFQYPTIHELSKKITFKFKKISNAEIFKQKATGNIPLTPIQTWFFENQKKDVNQWNQAVLLEIKQPIIYEQLNKSLQAIINHYDAFKINFKYNKLKNTWMQYYSKNISFNLDHIRLKQKEYKSEKQLRKIIDSKNFQLSLKKAPLIKAILIDTGKLKYLYIVMHHLICDGVSWRILLSNIQTSYSDILNKKTTALPANTDSYKTWANQLLHYVTHSKHLEDEINYWNSLNYNAVNIPIDYDLEPINNDLYLEKSVTSSLNKTETTILLKKANDAYQTNINDLLLSALTITLAQWTNNKEFCIDTESHGRTDVFNNINVANTIGWFTSIYPISLSLPPNTGISTKNLLINAIILEIKNQLSNIKNKGLTYGILYYLKEKIQNDINNNISKKLAQLKRTSARQLCFNYLGQIDQFLTKKSFFKFSDKSTGQLKSPRSKRNYLIEINCLVRNGRFEVNWLYNKKLHKLATIKYLSKSYLDNLKTIISTCINTVDEQIKQNKIDGPNKETKKIHFGVLPLNKNELSQILSKIRVQKYIKKYNNIENIYPIIEIQNGLIYYNNYHKYKGTYITQLNITIKGYLDVTLLQKSFQKIIDHHSPLRTAFYVNEPFTPVQIVFKKITAFLEKHDISHLKQNEQDNKISKYLNDKRNTKINIKKPPLLNGAIFKVNEKKHNMCFTMHHAIIDGWSINNLINELFDQYKFFSGESQQEAYFETKYENYIEWLYQQKSSPAKIFWSHLAKSIIQPTLLPVDKITDPYNNGSYQHFFGKLNKSLTHAITKFSHKFGLTINTILEGSWSILLSRYTDQHTITYGSVTSGRHINLPNIQKMIGLYINTTPMCVKITNNQNIINFLSYFQTLKSQIQEFGYYPISEIKKLTQLENKINLFEYLFVFENYSTQFKNKKISGNIQLTDVEIIEQTHYPLSIIISQSTDFNIRILYDSARFSKNTIELFLIHYKNILLSILNEQNKQTQAILPFSKQELDKLLISFNKTKKIDGHFLNEPIYHDFESQVKKHSTAIAIIDKNIMYSYKELYEHTKNIIYYLKTQGINSNQSIGICLSRDFKMIATILAILKIGATYVPIDPDYPKNRVKFILNNCKATHLITQKTYLNKLPKIKINLILTDDLNNKTYSTLINKYNEECFLPLKIKPNTLCCILYTSGSTGKPKGVCLTHKNIQNFISWSKTIFTKKEMQTVLFSTSLSFDMSLFEIFVTLSIGGKILIAKNIIEAPELSRFNEITCINTVPSSIQALISSVSLPKSVITIILAGEPLTIKLAQKLYNTSNVNKIYNCYGPTETGYTTYKLLPKNIISTPSIGKPITNVNLYVLDHNLNPVPIEIPGELYISGHSVSSGYLNNQSLTDAHFISNHLVKIFPQVPKTSNTKVLYKTGDIAYWTKNGELQYLGRIDNQIKIRGFRIEPNEIESKLNSYPNIKESIVFSKQYNDTQILYAFIVKYNRHILLQPDKINTYLKKFLPSYMVPSRYVTLDNMPLLPNGKINKSTLLTLTDQTRLSAKTTSPPKTNIEKKIAHIWSKALSINEESISLRDDFFDLGGNSLNSLQVVAKIKQNFNIDFKIKHLLEYPTINQISNYLTHSKNSLIKNASKKEPEDILYLDSLITLKTQGSHPPLFLFHPVGGTVFCYIPLVKHLKINNPCYGIQDPGINAGKPLFCSIEEMCTAYIKLIRHIQPKGPYYLCGASLGGTIAFEVARQLKNQNEIINFIGLIDAWAISPKQITDEKKFKYMLKRFYNLFKKEHIDGFIENPKPWIKLHWQRLKLSLKYIGGKINNPVALFKAQDVLPVYLPINDKFNHWQKYFTNPIRIYRIPGDHQTMLSEPHVRHLANKMSIELNDLIKKQNR